MSTAFPPSMLPRLPPTDPSRKAARAKRLTPALLALAAGLLWGAAGCFHGTPDELTSGVVSGAGPIAMAGTEPFFGGRVSVKVTVSRGIGKGLKGRGAGEDRRAYAENDSRTFVGSPLPPVTLHLILTNTGPGPVKVELIDFISDLGNFAVDPDTLTLAPGQTAEPTPMVSELGVTADSIPFKVTLKAEGKKESKTVTAVIVHDAPPPAGP